MAAAARTLGALALVFAGLVAACSDASFGGSGGIAGPGVPGGPVMVTPTMIDGFGGTTAPSCSDHGQCAPPNACVRGVCGTSPTCDGIAFDGPTLCFGWADLVDPNRWPHRFDDGSAPLELRVDGGVGTLGLAHAFRCPEVAEFFVNVGGEGTGIQPICGPNPELGLDEDGGYDGRPCCYGTIRVAGP